MYEVAIVGAVTSKALVKLTHRNVVHIIEGLVFTAHPPNKRII